MVTLQPLVAEQKTSSKEKLSIGNNVVLLFSEQPRLICLTPGKATLWQWRCS